MVAAILTELKSPPVIVNEGNGPHAINVPFFPLSSINAPKSNSNSGIMLADKPAPVYTSLFTI